VLISYGELLAGRAASAAGGQLEAVYLHGSAVLGGWRADRSDVDVLLVTARELAGPALDDVTAALLATVGHCPGRALECSVVTAEQAARPGEPWPFLVHVQAAPGGAGNDDAAPRIVRGAAVSGDADLLMHYAVARSCGWPLQGPPPRALIGAIPRPDILGYLAAELAWGLAHAPEAYCVLNACRALVYLADGMIVSKISGGETALRRGGPPALIRRALDQQRGQASEQPPQRDAAGYVANVAAALRSAAASPAACGPRAALAGD
jgi:streptomycin 3"-adenylyltransferase